MKWKRFLNILSEFIMMFIKKQNGKGMTLITRDSNLRKYSIFLKILNLTAFSEFFEVYKFYFENQL